MDEQLSRARVLAERGQWRELYDALQLPEAGRDGLSAPAMADPESETLLAEAELRLGQPAAARARLDALAPRLEGHGDVGLLQRACNLTGAALFALGDLTLAEEAFARAVDLATTTGDHLVVARATNNLGAIANVRGFRETALSRYKHSLAAYQRLGNVHGLAETNHNLAISYRDLGQIEQADKCECRAIEFGREAANPRIVAMARTGRAELSLMRGDARLAEAEARIAAADFARLADGSGEADAYRLIGEACVAQDRPEQALVPLDQAIALSHAHGSALIEAEALGVRARAHVAVGAPAAARTDAFAARDIFAHLGARANWEGMEALLVSLPPTV